MMDAGMPFTVVAGVHPGCFELFAHERNPHHQRPEGQSVGIPSPGREPAPIWCPCMAAYVGLDPAKDIELGHEPDESSRCSSSPKARSTRSSAFRPSPQELRARKIGHVILNSALDQPVVSVFLLHARRQYGFHP